MTGPQTKTRPYWHVDAKWVCGILAFFAVSGALLLATITSLTRRDFAVTATATVIASLFSREGLDATENVETLRQQAMQTPGDIVTPIADFPQLQISKQDALTLSPRGLRIKIFSQLTSLVYDKGLEGAAKELTDNPAERDRFVEQASVLGFFTQKTHDNIRSKLWIAVLVALVLLGGVTYFSAGWGRPLSIGLLLIIASWIGALVGLLASFPRPDGDGPFSSLPPNIASDLGESFIRSYGVAMLIGLVLLLVALIGKFLPRIRNKHSGGQKGKSTAASA